MARKELTRSSNDDKEKTEQGKIEANKARHNAHHDLSGPRVKDKGAQKTIKSGKR